VSDHVELDRERVARYAEVYRTDATAFGFHDSRALSATPVLPKF
jgi:glucarate dehydratase